MSLQEYLGVGSIVATLLVGIISWVLSSYLTKKSLTKKKINYEIKLFPIISNNFVTRTSDSQIYFHDKLLTEPTLLAVDIINSGNAAIECPPIEIEAVGVYHSWYIENVPTAYAELWQLEKNDDHLCAINLKHINPGQVVEARFF